MPENCLDPARERFSFNYVFHVCVPRLHAQQLLSRPNLSHTSSSPTLNSLPFKTGLHRVRLHLCVCMFYLHLYSVCTCVLIVFEGYFPEYKFRHVSCCLPSLQLIAWLYALTIDLVEIECVEVFGVHVLIIKALWVFISLQMADVVVVQNR